MKIIAVCGWEKFQHYKDRDPPWVKLYRDLLTTESWVLGTDTSRLVQVASILLAARYTNKIPYRWTLIRKVASLDCSQVVFDASITHLVSTSFLELQEVTEVASTPLADCATNFESLYSEAEAEKRQSRAEAYSDSDARAHARASKMLARSNGADRTDEPRVLTPEANPHPEASATRAPNGAADPLAELSRLKAAYPVGVYPQSDWLLAEREARMRAEEGQGTWDEFVAGAARYARQCVACETGTQFVASPKRFFTLPACKWRELFPLPASAERTYKPSPTTEELEERERKAQTHAAQ